MTLVAKSESNLVIRGLSTAFVASAVSAPVWVQVVRTVVFVYLIVAIRIVANVLVGEKVLAAPAHFKACYQFDVFNRLANERDIATQI